MRLVEVLFRRKRWILSRVLNENGRNYVIAIWAEEHSVDLPHLGLRPISVNHFSLAYF